MIFMKVAVIKKVFLMEKELTTSKVAMLCMKEIFQMDRFMVSESCFSKSQLMASFLQFTRETLDILRNTEQELTTMVIRITFIGVSG